MKLEPAKRFLVAHPDPIIISAWVLLMIGEFGPPLLRGLIAPKCVMWFFEVGLFNLPYWHYTGAMLKQGWVPTWAPQIFCGFPSTAYSGTNLAFPPFYLLMFLDFARSSSLESLLCFALGGAFAYLGFRRLALSPAASLVGMLASVGSMTALWESSYTWGEREILAFALSGWAVAGMSQGRFWFRSWLGLAVGMALLLSYHVELFVYSALFFQVVSLFLGPRDSRLKSGLLAASAIAAAVLALGAAALGTLEYAPHDVRGHGVTLNYYLEEAWGPQKLVETILPLPALYQGYPSPLYFGLSALWLVVLAVKQRGRQGLGQVAVIALILLLAADFRPLAWLAYHLPVLDRMLLHYYLGPAALVLAATLAARGADQVIATGFRSRWAWLAPALIGCAIAIGAMASENWSRVLLLLPLILVMAGAIRRPQILQARTRRALLIAAFVAVDLTLLILTRHFWAPVKWFEGDPEAIEFLEHNGPERFWVVSCDSFHDILLHPNLGLMLDPLLPGTSCPLGFWRHTPIRLARLINLISPGYLELADGKLNALRRDRPAGPDPFAPQALPLLSMMNVGWIISHGLDLPNLEGWERPFGRKFQFFHNPAVLPRARTVSRWQVARDEAESLAVLGSGQTNFAEEAVIESRSGKLSASAGAGPASQVRVRTFRPGFWDLDLGTGRDGPGTGASLLVVAETLLPGWRAFLDGRELPIHYADHAFMGVMIPPGPHRVILVHRPWSFRIGLWLSIVSMLAWPVLILARGLTRGGDRNE